MEKLGVLGGTFDPPHKGHLLIAHEAVTQLGLTQVLFAPTRQPPHKPQNHVTPIEHRVEMVRLAIAPYPRFVLSRMDVERDGPTYTADTMRLLREQSHDAVELYFIMGMDSLANLLSWHAPAQLIAQCRLAVFKRPGFHANLAEMERALPGITERVVMLNSTMLDIAASDLQKRVSMGESIAAAVPDVVEAYIKAHGLYRNS
ncbi:MAG: nicotinate-nucleotide adenylyltransferase [Chloroflexi bacterium]|nr:nicotinate-nucleotide adenylyltransferase [Chloroflexota bacterium]